MSLSLENTAPEFMCHRGVCCWHGLSASGGIRVRWLQASLLALCSGGFWLPKQLSFQDLGFASQARVGEDGSEWMSWSNPSLLRGRAWFFRPGEAGSAGRQAVLSMEGVKEQRSLGPAL